jgi:hypothetical protein
MEYCSCIQPVSRIYTQHPAMLLTRISPCNHHFSKRRLTQPRTQFSPSKFSISLSKGLYPKAPNARSAVAEEHLIWSHVPRVLSLPFALKVTSETGRPASSFHVSEICFHRQVEALWQGTKWSLWACGRRYARSMLELMSACWKV